MRETKQAEKETMPKQQREITVEIPGYQKLQIRYLILDYNGTIALDGTLQKGVAERLQQLSEQLENLHCDCRYTWDCEEIVSATSGTNTYISDK